METNQHGGQRANSGRKPLPETLKKKTSVIRIDADLLPLVEKLKQGLPVTQNQVWKQTSALSDADLKEQANFIERLTTDKAQLSAQVQQLEKQLHKIKTDNSLQAEIEALKAELKAAKANGNKLPSNSGALLAELEEIKRKNTFLSGQLEMDKLALIRSNTHILKCQCSTKAGRQCQNNATHETKHGGFYIAVCGQHFKELSKEN